eukprot:919072_1
MRLHCMSRRRPTHSKFRLRLSLRVGIRIFSVGALLFCSLLLFYGAQFHINNSVDPHANGFQFESLDLEKKTQVFGVWALESLFNTHRCGWDRMIMSGVGSVEETPIRVPPSYYKIGMFPVYDKIARAKDSCMSTYSVTNLRLQTVRPVYKLKDQMVNASFQFLNPFRRECTPEIWGDQLTLRPGDSEEIYYDRTVYIALCTSDDHEKQLSRFLSNFTATFSKDTNIHLTIVEFMAEKGTSSKDLTKGMNVEWIPVKGQFSRVIGLRTSIDSIRKLAPESDPLIFALDATMFLPADMMRLVRTYTSAGKAAFAPICRKHFRQTGEIWNYWGYGIISFYLSDYDSVSGYNMARAHNWGQEDT